MNDEQRDELLVRLDERTNNTYKFLSSLNISNTTDHANLMASQRKTNEKVGDNTSQISKIWGTIRGFAYTLVGVSIAAGIIKIVYDMIKGT